MPSLFFDTFSLNVIICLIIQWIAACICFFETTFPLGWSSIVYILPVIIVKVTKMLIEKRSFFFWGAHSTNPCGNDKSIFLKANLATSAAGYDVPERALKFYFPEGCAWSFTVSLRLWIEKCCSILVTVLIKSNPSSSITCMDHVHLYLMRQRSALLKLLTSNHHHQLKRSLK